LALAALQAGVQRFVFASSCSIYGQNSDSALTEDAPMNPQTAYARSKVDTESVLRELASDEFSPTMMRNATVYGLSPRLRFDLAVNNLTGWGFTTGKVKLLSDGRAWRPMVHVEDLCQACVHLLRAPREAVHNQAINIGAESENYQIRTVAETVASVVPGTGVTFAEGAVADSRTYNVSFAKLRTVVPEFTPRWTVERGVRQLFEALQAVSLDREGFESRLFTRLQQLQYLMATGALDADLRWAAVPARAA
jgi:nucleoside-diphosphate-sugar epimerase